MRSARRHLAAAAVATLVGLSAVGSGTTDVAAARGLAAIGRQAATNLWSSAGALSRSNEVVPAPDPLPHPVSVTIGLGAAPIVDFATAALANYFGEFAAENLKVKLIFQPATNEIVLLQSGRIQMAAMGLAAGVFNAVQEGTDLHMVLEGGTPGPADQDGVWVRNGLLSRTGAFDPCLLKHGHYTVDIGPDNNVGIVPLALLVQRCPGTTLGDVKSHMTFSPLAGPDLVAGLENGSVDLAELYDPLPVIPGLSKHATLEQKTPGSYNLDGWMMGPILKSEPAVAEAIIRAMVRTQGQYLEGDYSKNPRVLAAISRVDSEPEPELDQLPPTVFHDQISATGITQLQQDYLAYGGLLNFSSPLPPSRLIDSSLLTDVQAQG
jgi:NitT/TauT family transport system substrate-binding protein